MARPRKTMDIQTADMQTPESGMRVEEFDRRYWPEGVSMPTSVDKRGVPCPKCRRVLLDTMSRATVCTSSGADVAWFRCKACGAHFKMAVVK